MGFYSGRGGLNSTPNKQKPENDKAQSKNKQNGTRKAKNAYIMKQRYDFLKRRSIQLITLYPEISGAKERRHKVSGLQDSRSYRYKKDHKGPGFKFQLR